MFSPPSTPAAPALPVVPQQPAPPPMFVAQESPRGDKPKQKGEPSFIGGQLAANPSNTGQKTLLGT